MEHMPVVGALLAVRNPVKDDKGKKKATSPTRERGRAVTVIICWLLAAHFGWLCDGRCREREEAIVVLAAQAQGSRRDEDAVELLGRAIWACGAADHELYMGLGSELYARGDARRALAAFRSAWRLAPWSTDHANNVAAALIDTGQAAEAVALLRGAEMRCVTRAEATWKTHINMAGALAEMDLLEASAERWEAALAAAADFSHRPAAVANLIYVRMQLLRWSEWDGDRAAAAELCRQQVAGAFNYLAPALPVDPYMALSFLHDPAAVLAVASHAASLLAPPLLSSAAHGRAWSRDLRMDRVAVGYLGSEFGNSHSINLLMRGVFAAHDTRRVAVHCLALTGGAQPRSALERSCEQWVGLGGRGDREAAERVNGASLHILCDLNGWTAGHRIAILAARPAPVQLSYMGFPGSTGADFMDFAVFDRFTTPPEHAAFFSERLMLMSGSFWVTDYYRAELQDRSVGEERSAHGLAAGAAVLCNHDKAHKLDPKRLSSWLAVLGKLSSSSVGAEGVGGGAQLWMLAQGERTTRAVMAKTPPSLRAQVVLARKVGVRGHLARLRHCDVALDTRGINGHTTTSNYLWARVPVVTFPLQHVTARVAGGMLAAVGQVCAAAAVGLARSEADLVDIALALGDGARLQARCERRDACGGRRATVWAQARRCLEQVASDPRGQCPDDESECGGGAALFDTRGWVRRWEKLLFLAVELQVAEARAALVGR